MDVFFQAEDDIRDIGVTGVQTCALPILAELTGAKIVQHNNSKLEKDIAVADGDTIEIGSIRLRVLFKIGRASCGKECRSRWSPHHYKYNHYALLQAILHLSFPPNFPSTI